MLNRTVKEQGTRKGWHTFVLELTGASQLGLGFVAESEENRDVLLHELNAICQKTNSEVALVSARSRVMPLIEPALSFKVYSQSLRAMPISAEQSAYQLEIGDG